MEISGEGHLSFDDSLSTRSVRKLNVDLEMVDHVNIYGLVGMAAAVLSAAKSGRDISIAPPLHSSSACAFMSRLNFDGFVRSVGGADCEFAVTSRQDPKDVLVPVSVIRSSKDLQPLQNLLWERLEGVARPQSRSTLIESLWELGANVTEHSGSEGVMAAVVQRPGRREAHIDFAIGDAGVGIRKSFLQGGSGHHPNSDHQAISLALEYLVSSVNDPGRGQGLPTTVEEVTGLGGRVTIRSGTARRVLFRNEVGGLADITSKSSSVPHLDGTLVAVSLPCR